MQTWEDILGTGEVAADRAKIVDRFTTLRSNWEGADFPANPIAGQVHVRTTTNGRTVYAFVGDVWIKLDNRVNVRWFGAKGDGATDDTAALHAARSAAGPNATVYVPPGTYIVAGLNMNQAGQVWYFDDFAILKMKPGVNAAGGEISAANVRLVNMTYNGNRANVVQNVSAGGWYIGANGARINFRDCYEVDGFGVTSNTAIDDFGITGKVRNCSRTAVLIQIPPGAGADLEGGFCDLDVDFRNEGSFNPTYGGPPGGIFLKGVEGKGRRYKYVSLRGRYRLPVQASIDFEALCPRAIQNLHVDAETHGGSYGLSMAEIDVSLSGRLVSKAYTASGIEMCDCSCRGGLAIALDGANDAGTTIAPNAIATRTSAGFYMNGLGAYTFVGDIRNVTATHELISHRSLDSLTHIGSANVGPGTLVALVYGGANLRLSGDYHPGTGPGFTVVRLIDSIGGVLIDGRIRAGFFNEVIQITTTTNVVTDNISVSGAQIDDGVFELSMSLGGGGSVGEKVDCDFRVTPGITFATPGDLSLSAVTATGRVRRRGKWADVELDITFTPTFSTASGSLRITGLPFTAVGFSALLVDSLNAPFTWPSGRTMVSASAINGQKYCEVYGYGSGVNAAPFTTAHLTSGQSHHIKLCGAVRVG